jgi:UDP-N-acetylglucosamine 2-epimerase
VFGLEPILLAEQPDLVIVVGDVNSTLAAALAAAKMNLSVAHVEAGLPSGDRAMPEEINRILTDSLSELLFATCRDAVDNLGAEGIVGERVAFAGNPMIDTLDAFRNRALQQDALSELNLTPSDYGLVTFQRPSSVDDPSQLKSLCEVILALAEECPVVFSVHRMSSRRTQTRCCPRPSRMAIRDFGSPQKRSVMMRASGNKAAMRRRDSRCQSGSVCLIQYRFVTLKSRRSAGLGKSATGAGSHVCESMGKYRYGVCTK